MFKEVAIEARDGWFNVPSGPGLGVEIDEEKIAQHPYRPLQAGSVGRWAPEQWYRKTAP